MGNRIFSGVCGIIFGFVILTGTPFIIGSASAQKYVDKYNLTQNNISLRPQIFYKKNLDGIAPLMDCDLLAGLGSNDPLRWMVSHPQTPYIRYNDLDGQRVVEACQNAIGKYPAEIRFRHYYARGLAKLGKLQDVAAVFHRLHEMGDVQASYQLGNLYYDDRWPTKPSLGYRYLRYAADRGHANAQHQLTFKYTAGDGVREDYAQAYIWGSIAANSGVENAVETTSVNSVILEESELALARTIIKTWEPIASPNVQVVGKAPRRRLPSQAPKKKSTNRSTSGSGFVVTKLGHIITNAHVVKNCRNIQVGSHPNQRVNAELISTDRPNDLALLRQRSASRSVRNNSLIEPTGINIGERNLSGSLRSNDVVLGEKVIVAGFPFGSIISKSIKITSGIVSSTVGFGDNTGQFQLDAAVQPGNSGGPIFDNGGNIVGIVVSRINKLKMAKAIGVIPENSNFGIKASIVRTFLASHGLSIKGTSKRNTIPTEQIAKLAEKQTVIVRCVR